jgi:hypothetical protein
MPVSQSSQLSSQVKRSLEGCDARLGKLSKDALPSSLLLNSVISLASRLSRVEPWRVAQYSRISNFLRPSALIETARGRRRVARTAQSPVNIMSPCGTAHFISRSSHHRRRSRASTGVKGSSRREKSRSELVEQAACSVEEREWRSSWALKGRPGPTADCITHTGLRLARRHRLGGHLGPPSGVCRAPGIFFRPPCRSSARSVALRPCHINMLAPRPLGVTLLSKKLTCTGLASHLHPSGGPVSLPIRLIPFRSKA